MNLNFENRKNMMVKNLYKFLERFFKKYDNFEKYQSKKSTDDFDRRRESFK